MPGWPDGLEGPQTEMFYLFVSEKNLFQIIILGDFLCRVGLMGCRGELPGEVVPAPGGRTMSQGDFMCRVVGAGCWARSYLSQCLFFCVWSHP